MGETLPTIRLGELERAIWPPAFSEHRRLPMPRLDVPPLGRVGRSGLAARGRDDPAYALTDGARTEAHLFVLDRPTVASSTGVVATANGLVIEDTLDHLRLEDRLVRRPDGLVELPPVTRRLSGSWLSLLLGGHENHFHLMLMNLLRAGLLEPHEVTGLAGILLPAGLPAAGRRLAERVIGQLCAQAGCAWPVIVELPFGERIAVERLLLPWNAGSGECYHPAGTGFLRQLRPAGVTGSRRLYIDRRGSGARPLRNEAAVVSALERLGFQPVRLERVGFDGQMQLMAEAAIVVAPHGAGLANLVFAEATTRVIELMPDRLSSWCYRVLCASLGLPYEAVMASSAPDGDPGLAACSVDPAEVSEAVEASLAAR